MATVAQSEDGIRPPKGVRRPWRWQGVAGARPIYNAAAALWDTPHMARAAMLIYRVSPDYRALIAGRVWVGASLYIPTALAHSLGRICFAANAGPSPIRTLTGAVDGF